MGGARMNHISHKLSKNPLRKSLVQHGFFKLIRANDVTLQNAGIFIGQWWHPLHFFPTFLSGAIASATELEVKTAISAILFQELGEGIPARAHEKIYVDTLTQAGFSEDTIKSAPASKATERLISGYRNAAASPFTALGFVYGTEVVDLVMVTGIGQAVRKATGVQELPWVDIHVAQEPGHVQEASHALNLAFSDDAAIQIEHAAEEMWRLWIDFFSALERQFQPKPQPPFGSEANDSVLSGRVG
jgi:hypothetical protein